MKSGLGDRNNGCYYGDHLLGRHVSMKSGLGDRNNLGKAAITALWDALSQ